MATGPAEFQGALVRLSDALGGEVRKVTGALARLDQRDAMRYVTDAYPEIASPYLAAAGDLSATWYEEQPTKKAGRLFVAKPAELPEVEQLAANGRWALTQQDPAGALIGSSRRQTFNQSRETILNNVEEEGVRWVRHARSGACGFCRMLATRALTEGRAAAPGLYRSKGSASRNTHRFETGHDFCRCIVLPLREGAAYVAPDYLPQWLDDYDAVAYERSADGNEYLLPPQTIANRMEAIGRERGDFGDHIHGPRAAAEPDVVDLDQPATVSARRLTERNATRADAAVQPIADRVTQAKQVAERADSIVSTAATVTAKTKTVVDVADKLLGGTYPAVRATKQLVDAADKALGSASQVTSGAATVTRVAERTLRDTTAVAHGAKQIVDGVTDVIDEAAAIALGARAMAADTGKAIADVRGAGGLSERAKVVVDAATGIRADAEALVERARGTVEAAQGVVESIGEVPAKLRAPIRDMQSLARHVQDVAADVQTAGVDAAGVAAGVRQLVDALRDYRHAETTVVDEAGAPIRVQSERLDVAGDQAAPAIEAPSRQVALNRPPAQLAIEAARQPKMLTAAPSAPPIPPPAPAAIAEWLDAEDAHRAAVDYWRRVDAENLHSLPPIQRIPEPPALAVDDLPPAEKLEVPGDDRPVADVQAPDVAGESAMDRAVREFEEAVAAGDDGLIEQTAGALEALEAAEAKAAERKAKAAARREGKRNAEFDEMARLIDEGYGEEQAEVAVLIRRPEYQKKIDDELARSGDRIVTQGGLTPREAIQRDYENRLLARIRRRDFMAQARADGHSGKGFDDLIDSVYQRRAEELYIEAENATHGQMVKRKFAGKFDPKRFWYCNDATARKYISEELAEWFDQNGRVTRPVMRQMVLDGTTSFDRYTAMVGDYLQ